MKAKIFTLIFKGFTNKQIVDITGYKLSLIYYYRRVWKREQEELDKMLMAWNSGAKA